MPWIWESWVWESQRDCWIKVHEKFSFGKAVLTGVSGWTREIDAGLRGFWIEMNHVGPSGLKRESQQFKRRVIQIVACRASPRKAAE